MTTTAEHESPHIANLRRILMIGMAVYTNDHEGVTDAHVLGAVSATMCQMLAMKGIPFDDDLVDVLRKTYEVCEIQHAMMDKENNSVQ